MPELGVNIDHVATLRQARKTYEPDPVWAAMAAELGGADGITVHLREDRRHIQDRDLRLLRETVTVKLNLELSCNRDVLTIAGQIRPDQATLVPERREEITTEGGLDAVAHRAAVAQAVREMKAAGIHVSLFLDPLIDQIELAAQVGAVFMTGDWIAQRLTGQRSLSTSDALSNGLLDQKTRQRADAVIEKAGFCTAWFPQAAQSGTVVGTVQADMVSAEGGAGEDPWQPLRETLAGWQFVAGLGDNHASAVGCGMTDDYRKLVVSGGTSGTINLSCPKNIELPENGDSLRFEFYGDSLLLLLMLADCGDWYNRFLDRFAPELKQTMDELNNLALSADLTALRRVLHDDAAHSEVFPPSWGHCTLGAKVADTQLSIALELLLRVKRMLAEVRAAGASNVDTYVLTGGLSQSLFFQCLFYAGIKLLAPEANVQVSGRTGPLRYKTSAYGALINAELPRVDGKLSELHAAGNRFPLVDCVQPQGPSGATLQYLLQSYGI